MTIWREYKTVYNIYVFLIKSVIYVLPYRRNLKLYICIIKNMNQIYDINFNLQDYVEI